MNKPTFKKRPKPTGLQSIGYPYQSVDIKYKKKKCGYIHAPNWQTKNNLWTIRLVLKKEKTKEDPAPFKWVNLKAKFETEEDCRKFLIENWEAIVKDLDLYFFEEGD